MRLLKFLLTFLMLANLTTITLSAAPNDSNTNQHEEELNDRDLQSLRDFLHTKRTKDLLDKMTHLSFSGDVRTEWRHIDERVCGKEIRGRSFENFRGVPFFGRNDFDIEFNFVVSYETDRTWAIAHLDYDNAAGVDRFDCCCDKSGNENCSIAPTEVKEKVCKRCPLKDENGNEIKDKNGKVLTQCSKKHHRYHGSGTWDDINLKRCYMGYEIYADGCTQIDVELGRRKMYDVFESDIQYNTRFDALVFEAGTTFEHIARTYWKIAGFVVDERINHFAWATEIGLLNIADAGLDFKYSFVDWHKNGRDRCGARNPRGFKYLNSQVILTYHLDQCMFGLPDSLPAAIYGCALYNHRVHHGTKGLGWYAGFMIGDVEHEGDWSFEIEYQWVGKDAVAYDDSNGIGLGDALADFCDGPGPTPGYKGWQIDTVYALTDNLVIDTTIQWARSNQSIRHTFSTLQVEAVYGF